MKVYGIVGWKNSGKTTLMERLVAEIAGRGLRVSTVKHAHHAFDVDKPGKDSFRHREAGATETLVSSGARWALMHELRGEPEPPLADLLARLSAVDVVLVEGFKTAGHPKVEVHRADTGAPLIAANDDSVRAVATNDAVDAGRPLLPLDDPKAVADFILRDLGIAA